ncbi:hypothetical protein ARTHRO8AJ_300072 [Arthrobacter sp. 8AJ]|nr:hypothetical protein ARTHRO8AJ_300072 [Arthrobacter sp. 8AJ]
MFLPGTATVKRRNLPFDTAVLN